MISHISIRDFAIIENTEIDFDEGLNIVTGETGAGKSIVIEAISLALGSRADSAYVRHGSDKAIVQLCAELDGDDYVITREVSASGKNLCRLNGSIVTLSQLLQVCSKIADIHGQYDNQLLLNPDNHLNLIDQYGKSAISPLLEQYEDAYGSYMEKKQQLARLLASESDSLRKKDFYTFEINEIDRADVKKDEDQQLQEKISLLQNSEKIFDALETAYSAISDSELSSLSTLGKGVSALQSVQDISPEIASLSSQLDDIYYKADDLSQSLRQFREKITFSPDELDSAISRLDTLEMLKKKYGTTLQDVLDYRDRISCELETIENFDDVKEKLIAEEAQLEKAVKTKADLLSQARMQWAEKLQHAIEEELYQLNFNESRIAADFRKSGTLLPTGFDCVEFLISTNRGEPLKPLAKVASGGEISRIMLAIKKITADCDNVPTMIFDEIDAGISGITASVVGKKLKEISGGNQIICITHLPQIAAYGESNYRIVKSTDSDKTFTSVEKLSYNEKVDEIARLLGGSTITETTLKSARELIDASASTVD